MLQIDPTQIATKDLHQYILGAVAPRPIAFASTISTDGIPNLAPYSFFNAFSSNPPILIFSSNRRVSNNTTKDTLKNVEDTGEVVINVVSHRIVRQMAVTSIEYPASVSEFEKAGFTPLPSERVKPFRVAESPVHMECKVDRILPLGDKGGAGNLIICNIVLMHIDENVLNENGRIDPHKIDLMGRMGRFYYVRASGAAVEEIVQVVTSVGIGFDALPPGIRNSTVLTGNNLGRLASLTALPDADTAMALAATDERVQALLQKAGVKESLHQYAKEMIDTGEVERGAEILVLAESFR
ncbi:MAG: flavin reductase family protein [Lewinellaceae bacterium]|nr:flavin reductase family protein [Lewinellaceae bacterium]MCB9356386.1 flavin reductase family protein [Lewinellaceae bacterium]